MAGEWETDEYELIDETIVIEDELTKREFNAVGKLLPPFALDPYRKGTDRYVLDVSEVARIREGLRLFYAGAYPPGVSAATVASRLRQFATDPAPTS